MNDSVCREELRREVKELRGEVRRMNVLGNRLITLIRSSLARWLTIDEASAYTGYSRERLYVLIRSGKLRKAKPIGGKIFIKRAWLDEFINNNTEKDYEISE